MDCRAKSTSTVDRQDDGDHQDAPMSVAETTPGRTVLKGDQMSKLTIIKNLAIVCTSFMLSYVGKNGNRNLQSSLYEDNLGNVALTFYNVAFLISCLFLASPFQVKFGLKWSLVVCLLMMVAYPASNFYPVPYVMYTGAAISGLAAGPMWSSKSSYLVKLGVRYAALSGEPPEVAIARFIGMFYMMFNASILIGNGLSSIVIHRPASTHVMSDDKPDIVRSVCGAHYCYEDLDVVFGGRGSISDEDATTATNSILAPAIYHPSTFQIQLLFGIYVLCGCLAVPLCATIHPIGADETLKPMKIVDALLATLRHMTNPKEILIMPLSLLGGISIGFITADYCLGFITCSIGIDNVGFVMSTVGAAALIFSLMAGPMVKYVGRKASFAFSALCQAAAIVGMLTWPPEAHSLVILCIFAGLCGIGSAAWSTLTRRQIQPFLGIVFQDDRQRAAAFACNYLWMAVGTSVWHSFSLYMCLNVQLYVIAGILAVGMGCYAALELVLKLEAKQTNMTDDAPPGIYKSASCD